MFFSISPADIRKVCVSLHSESSEPTILFSQTMPDEHPPTPPLSRWPALITLPTPAKFQLVWRRLCAVVLFPFCLVKHGLTDAPLCIEYRFQDTRDAPSTLQLRSRGGPSLLYSALSRVLPPSLPPIVRSVSLPPSFPASLPPSRYLRPFSLHPPSALLHPGGSIESTSTASS